MLSVSADQRLESVGIVDPASVFWNLSTAALYEEAVARREGTVAKSGPLVCRTGPHTGRSPRDRFLVDEPSTTHRIAWGDVNRPIAADRFEAVHRAVAEHLRGRDLFVQDCYAGADPDYRLRVRVVTEKAWHALFARHLLITESDRSKLAGPRSRADGDQRGLLPGRPADPRDELRGVHPARPRQAPGADRGHQLCRRDKEVGVRGDELPVAPAARASHALRRERRVRGRRGRVLRSVGHRQDDAVERPRPAAHRGRRARVERPRGVQLRGRMLREDDPAVGRGRAADLRHDAAVRDGARERDHRSGDPSARSR